MPAGVARFRTGASAPLAVQAEFPPWAELLHDYRLAPEPGHETAEFEDGAVQHHPSAAATVLRRRLRVEVGPDRIGAWRRFVSTAVGRELRYRDPDDGVRRLVTLEAAAGGIDVRQVSDRPGRFRWQSDIVLTGWSDDIVEE